MIFDFAKQTSLKYIDFYRLFENREISNVKKNVIKPDDLSTFQFWYVERSRGGAVQHHNNNNHGVLVARGGLKSSIPAIKLNTLRGGRKETQNITVVGIKP